jgi:integrase
VSLDAFRLCPDGFERYRGSSASLSATVNKYLATNGLLETDQHVMYSLRHSFEDRMIAAEVDERHRADLFGHKHGRPRYGEGATLEHKQRIIQSFAL